MREIQVSEPTLRMIDQHGGKQQKADRTRRTQIMQRYKNDDLLSRDRVVRDAEKTGTKKRVLLKTADHQHLLYSSSRPQRRLQTHRHFVQESCKNDGET